MSALEELRMRGYTERFGGESIEQGIGEQTIKVQLKEDISIG